MKPRYFNPNWRLINGAITTDGLKDLRQAQRDLEKKIQKKVNEFFRAKKEAERAREIAKMKALPAGTKLYINKSNDPDFGAECTKVSDGRTRIHFEMNGKRWNAPYLFLRIEPPTEQEIKDRKLGIAISRIFNKAINV